MGNYINEEDHYAKILDPNLEKTPAGSDSKVVQDLGTVFAEYEKHVQNGTVHFASTWLLEKEVFLGSEQGTRKEDKQVLSRGRVVFANPGVSGIGREQKYIHPYIVLGEHQGVFIGVPFTNKARDKKTGKYYLRHYFEVDLIDPKYKKPYTEYRCSKPSVADVRNICGLDKRRIIKDVGKFVPKTYLDAISQKIRDSIAIL